MSDEIQVTFGVSYTNGDLNARIPNEVLKEDQTNAQYFARSWNVGTGGATLTTASFGDIPTGQCGYLFARNTHASANCTLNVGPATGGTHGMLLKPDQIAVIPVNGSQNILATAATQQVTLSLLALAR